MATRAVPGGAKPLEIAMNRYMPAGIYLVFTSALCLSCGQSDDDAGEASIAAQSGSDGSGASSAPGSATQTTTPTAPGSDTAGASAAGTTAPGSGAVGVSTGGSDGSSSTGGSSNGAADDDGTGVVAPPGPGTSSPADDNGAGGASAGAEPALGAGGANGGAGGSSDSAGSGAPVDAPGAGAGGQDGAGGASAGGGDEPPGDGQGGAAGEPTDAPSQEALESTGCAVAASPDPCDTSGSPCTIDVGGVTREYYVVLPDSYDATTAYPVVFQFHPLGGNAEQGMNMYRVRQEFPDAIYVTPDGLASGNNQGWPNTGGQDEALTRAIVAEIEAQYCIDRQRYFSTGFSYGGSMSFTAALCMSDIFRAIGAMAGAPISGAGNCDPERPVAAWINHGEDDTALPIDMALPLRDELVAKNGCSMETVPVDPAPCVAYQGCDEGYPVIWCAQANTGHAIPSYGAATIAAFFQQF